MAFTRSVLTPKQSYTQSDHDLADEILADRREVEPRCADNSEFCIRLRHAGPFVLYTGTGADAGKRLYLSFLSKGEGVLRLAYIAPRGFTATAADRLALGRLVGRTVRDALLQAGATLVYWYVQTAAPANVDKIIMEKVGERIGEVFTDLHVISREDGGFLIWEATLA